MKISILTATYNRAHLLPGLYQSLLQNKKTFDDFEWLIMDDGSKDQTEELVKGWIKEKKIEIHYYKQKNQGKMAAINHLNPYVTGDIWIEMDSDDYFKDDVLAKISKDYETLDEGAYGILYYKQLGNMKVKKDETLENQIIKLYDMHYQYGYSYDMALTFKTSARKKFIYELEHHEKFITEARLYYKMDLNYNGLLIKNDVIMHCEYIADGYSKNIREIFKKYPYGYYEYFKELLNYPNKKILFKKRIYMIKHYILFSVLTHQRYSEAFHSLSKIGDRLLFILLYFPGSVKTKYKIK